MLRLTRTAIGLLTAQYRSVLKKCWAINVGVFGLMGKAATGVAGGAVNAISGALTAFGVNVVDVLSMMRSLDSMLGIQRHPDVEHRGTEGSSDALGITSFLQNDWILRFVNTPLRMTGKGATLPAAVVAATVMATTLTAMPTEAEAATATGCSALTASSSLTDVINCLKSSTLAVGYYSNASGSISFAVGRYNTAEGFGSSAFGLQNTASGEDSSAFGYNNTAEGYRSSAFGGNNKASGSNSSAFGYQSNAAKNYTTAIGYQAVANVAGTTTQGIISVGHKNGDPHGYDSNNYTSDYFSRIINVADGTDAHDAATVGQMNTALNNYYTKSEVDSDYLHRLVGNAVAFGDSATSTGDYGIAIGQGATASSDYGIAIGGGSNGTKASGYAGVAVGVLATAASELSVAIGHNAGVLAQSYRGTALGGNSSASANYAVALGAESRATEAYTVSVGKSDLKRRITNVAAGSAANDAVIVSQLGFDIATYPTVANYVSNNYYRKEDLGGRQVIDFTRYFKTGKFGENAQFLNNQSATFDAERAENVPAAELRRKIGNETSKKFAEMPHNSPAGEGTLSAFHRKAESVMDNLSKCRAANDNSSIISNSSNDKTGVFGAPTVAGTSRHCLRQFSDVLDSFLQTVANINVVNDNLTVVTTSKVA